MLLRDDKRLHQHVLRPNKNWDHGKIIIIGEIIIIELMSRCPTGLYHLEPVTDTEL